MKLIYIYSIYTVLAVIFISQYLFCQYKILFISELILCLLPPLCKQFALQHRAVRYFDLWS